MERSTALGPWVLLLMAALMSGCGGGATHEQKGSSPAAAARARPYSAIDAAPAAGPVSDRTQWPEIVQLEQVAATRVDRTKFDYTFAIHLRGSGLDIKDGRFTVTAVGDGSTVRDGVASLASLSAGRYQVLSDTITIRHDRTKPFDASKIAFDFGGTIATQARTGTTAPRIASVSFSAFGGRPGHEGYFRIDSSEPTAGQQVELSVLIRGTDATATYQLLSTSGAVISGAALVHPSVDLDEHVAQIEVPSQDFVISVVATAPDGARADWTSDIYRPRRQLAQFVPAGGAPFTRGQDITGEIVVGPAFDGSTSEITLVLPAGFGAAQSKWLLAPSTIVTRIPVRITTPANIPPFTFVEFGVGLKAGSNSQRWMHSVHMLAR